MRISGTSAVTTAAVTRVPAKIGVGAPPRPAPDIIIDVLDFGEPQPDLAQTPETPLLPSRSPRNYFAAAASLGVATLAYFAEPNIDNDFWNVAARAVILVGTVSTLGFLGAFDPRRLQQAVTGTSAPMQAHCVYEKRETPAGVLVELRALKA